MVDWSATAAWIMLALTLVISIISPVITTYLNNRFQLKRIKLENENKEKEVYYQKRQATIDAFISSTGKCIFLANSNSYRELGEAFYSIYLYVPSSLWPDIDKLLELANKGNWDEARKHFIKVSKSLAEISEGKHL